MPGIMQLRDVVHCFGDCNETFNTQWSFTQLIQLYRMMLASGWDYLPDQWTEEQVRDALVGIPPSFIA